MMELVLFVATLAALVAVAAAMVAIRRAVDADRELRKLRDQIAPFDRDGDGKIGGSKPRGKG